MHTYLAKKNTTFHFNSDFSGDVIIHNAHGNRTMDFMVSGEDFLEFAKFIVASEIIEKLEEEYC